MSWSLLGVRVQDIHNFIAGWLKSRVVGWNNVDVQLLLLRKSLWRLASVILDTKTSASTFRLGSPGGYLSNGLLCT